MESVRSETHITQTKLKTIVFLLRNAKRPVQFDKNFTIRKQIGIERRDLQHKVWIPGGVAGSLRMKFYPWYVINPDRADTAWMLQAEIFPSETQQDFGLVELLRQSYWR